MTSEAGAGRSAMTARCVVVLALLALVPFGLAHGPGIDVTQVRSVATPEGSFLEMKVDAPEVDERHDLLAVVGGQGPAVLEQERGGSYRPVEAIPVAAGPQRFGAATPYRIRLPGGASRRGDAGATLLFSGGEVVRVEIPADPAGRGPLSPLTSALLAAAVLLLVAALAWFLRSRFRRRGRAP